MTKSGVNTLLMTLFTLFSYFMDGFAYAGEALAGKYYGAKDETSFRTVVRQLFFFLTSSLKKYVFYN